MELGQPARSSRPLQLVEPSRPYAALASRAGIPRALDAEERWRMTSRGVNACGEDDRSRAAAVRLVHGAIRTSDPLCTIICETPIGRDSSRPAAGTGPPKRSRNYPSRLILDAGAHPGPTSSATPRPVSGLRSTAGRAPRPPTQPPRRRRRLRSPSGLPPSAPTQLPSLASTQPCPTSFDIGLSLNSCPRKLGAPQPLVELLIDTEAELFDLAVRSGLQVLDAMLK